jgi:hypothetical protein
VHARFSVHRVVFEIRAQSVFMRAFFYRVLSWLGPFSFVGRSLILNYLFVLWPRVLFRLSVRGGGGEQSGACEGNGAVEERRCLVSGGWLELGTAEVGGLAGDSMLPCSPSLFVCLEGDMVSRAVSVKGGEERGWWKRGGASCPLLVCGACLQPGTAGDRRGSPNPRSCFCCGGAKSAIAPSSCR